MCCFCVLRNTEDEYRNDQYKLEADLFNAADNDLGGDEMHVITDIKDEEEEANDTISNILVTILLLMISVMVFVAIFYLCVSREKSWLHSAVEKWTSHSLNWTATEDDYNESSPFAGYDGNNSNAECDGSSLSSSLEFEENENEIELCGINNNKNVKKAGSISDKTITSLDRCPENDNNNNNYGQNNKHYYKLSMDKPYQYRNKSLNLSSGSLLSSSLSNGPFSDEKIVIFNDQMYE